MIRILITNGQSAGGEKDYTRYVVASTLKIVKTLNAPSTCTFQMSNFDAGFVEPVGRSYIRVISTNRPQAIFTGYMPAAPTKQFLGLTQFYYKTRRQLFNQTYSFTSDEYLLNIKSVPFIPAYINMHAGTILQKLAEYLCPSMFDFTNCQPGVLIPYQAYDPTSSWSQLAKTFGDASRYRYSCINHQIVFAPYGDGPLGFTYDEDGPESTFDPNALTTSALVVPVVNDVTIIGQQEAGNCHDDHFIGTGFDGVFSLRHQVFNGGSSDSGTTNGTVFIADAWTETQIDENTWILQDPQNNFNLVDGALNIITPLLQPNILGEDYLIANQALELAGGVVVQHGEFTFNNASKGLIGGLYTAETLDVSSCLCAFEIDYGPTLDVTASGAAGITIKPYCPNADLSSVGAFNPATVTTKINKTYVLTTIIAAPSPSRFTQVYTSLGGVVYGGTSLNDSTSGTITWSITETDIFTGEITVYTGSLNSQKLPAYCVYALINNEALNCNFNTTSVYAPPLGSLNINSEVGSGLLGPIYISGNLQYTGAYVTPSGGNLPIIPGDLGQEHVWPLGSSLQNQTAEIDIGNVTSVLNFYGDNMPGTGVRVRLTSWESQAALSRVQDPASINTEIAVVGDNGIRACVVNNLSPNPRTSEDCDAAAQAYLADRVSTFYQGTYSPVSTFQKQFTTDIEYYPVPGRYLFINTKERGIVKQNLLVSDLTITFLEMVTEVLQYSIDFGADLKLEKTLATFVNSPANTLLPQNATIQLTPQQMAQVGAVYLPDVLMSAVDSTSITGVSCVLNFTDPIPALTGHLVPNVQIQAVSQPFYEIRAEDYSWGINNSHLIGRVFKNGATTLTRYGYENIFYIRLVQLDNTGAVVATSRRSRVIRIVYPQVPSPPAFLYADSGQIKFDFSGDIRNIEGIELYDASIEFISNGNPGGNSPPIIVVGKGNSQLLHRDHKMKLSAVGSGGSVSLGGVQTGSLPVSLDPDVQAQLVARYGQQGITITALNLIYQGLVGSEADMDFDLNSLRGDTGITGSNINANIGHFQIGLIPQLQRSFVVRFFNLMWEYSTPVAVNIPFPEAPILSENFRFGSSLCLQTAGTARTDIQTTNLQIASDSAFNTILIEAQAGGANAQFTSNVPATGDLYARACFADFISSGGWSNTLHIPQKNLIGSSYLAAQGSIPPAITAVDGGGGIMVWSTTDASITISNEPFTLLFPDGTQIPIPIKSQLFGSDLDTGASIQANTMYGFFPAVLGAVTKTPTFVFNGPYKNYTTSSLIASLGAQVADGSTPLSNGAIVIQTQVAGVGPTGSTGGGGTTGGGGGGGTGGGPNCGILSSMITLGNGAKSTLGRTSVGTEVMNIRGTKSRIKFRLITKEETWTIETESGKCSTTALGHVEFSNGKWRFREDIIRIFQEEKIGTLRNDANVDEKIVKCIPAGKQKICRIELAPIDATLEEASHDYWHVYSLDGFLAHNFLKS